MKKSFVMVFCLVAVFLLAACAQITVNPAGTQTPAASVAPAKTSAQPSVQPSVSAPVVTPMPTIAAPSASAQPAAPSNTAQMYSSYAHMASFDPKTGWAQFDYFDMLKGKDAVQWLVQNKGYTKASAEAEVNEYADSEFIEKNENSQLRTIDLNSVPLRMMYTPDGNQVESPDPVPATVDDVRALYAKDPSLVLKSYFYYIKVENGKVSAVDQVYWP